MSAIETSFYVTGGTLSPDAPSYVERRADADLYDGLGRGEFCYVLTARQMGKSSLTVHTAARLRREGVAVAILDLTTLGRNVSADQWYYGLLGMLGEQLDLKRELRQFWLENSLLGPLQRWMAALRDVVLTRCPGRVVIFIDEIDAVISLPFSTDEFFAAIRECYNHRAQDAEYRRLSFCLLGVAAPSSLIRDARLTPFNIGRRVALTDFTEAEAAPLALGLPHRGGRGERGGDEGDEGDGAGALINTPTPQHLNTSTPHHPAPEAQRLLKRILYWTGGHPYLTQRLCQAVAETVAANPKSDIRNPQSVDALCERLFLAHGARERDDNLLFVRERLLKGEADPAGVLDLYAHLWRGRRVPDDQTNPHVTALRLSGVARVVEGCLRVRNRIYHRVFDRAWARTNMPDAEQRRQRAAYRRGVVRASAVAAVVISVTAGLALTAIHLAREARDASAQARQNQRLANSRADRATRLAARLQKALEDRNRALSARQKALLTAESEKNRAKKAERGERSQRQRAETALGQAKSAQRQADTSANVARSEKQNALRLLAMSHVDRGIRLLQEDDTLGLLDLLDARKTADRIPDTRLQESITSLWAGWHQSIAGRLVEVLGHDGPANSVAFSPDGKLLASCSDDGTTRLWDTATWQPHGRPLHHDGPVTRVLFSPDGRLLATRCKNCVWLWQADSGRLHGSPLQHSGYVTGETFSPDGKLLAVRGSSNVWLWDTASGRPHGGLLHHDSPVLWLAFSPLSARLLVSASLTTLYLWDARSGQFRVPPMRNENTTDGFAFSRDGRLLAVGSYDRTVRLWDTSSLQLLGQPFRLPGFVEGLAFSPDGRLLAARGENTAHLWDLGTARAHCPPLSHPETIRRMAFSPEDGKLLATLSGGVVRLWETATGRPYGPPLRNRGAITELAFSRNGRLLASASADAVVRLWDPAPAEYRFWSWPHSDRVSSMAFRRNGRDVVTAAEDGLLRLWDTTTGRLLGQRALYPPSAYGDGFSSDGALLATREGNTLRLWDTVSGRPRGQALRHVGLVRKVALSGDGKLLAAVAQSRLDAVQLWDTARGTAHGRPLQNHVRVERLVFSPNGKLLATAGANSVRLWDTATGRLHIPALLHRGAVLWVAFTPDSKGLATAAQGDIALWDTTNGRPFRSSLRHMAPVNDGAFSPDGKLLATASSDNVVRLWDTAAGRLHCQPLPHPASVRSIQFSVDGKLLATAAGTCLRLWDVYTGQPYSPPLQHEGLILSLAFSPDGKQLATRTVRTVRLWRLPGPPAGVREMEVRTWVALDALRTASGATEAIPWQKWRTLRGRLPPGQAPAGAATQEREGHVRRTRQDGPRRRAISAA